MFRLQGARQQPASLTRAPDGAASSDVWWSTPHLSVSSPAGLAWPGFLSEVWNPGSEAGLAGSTSWLLHSLPGHTNTKQCTHYKAVCAIYNYVVLFWLLQ